MEVQLLLGSSRGEPPSAATVAAAFDHWRRPADRLDALEVGHGFALGVSRVVDSELAFEEPAVRHAGPIVYAERWGWSGLESGPGGTRNWLETLPSLGPRAVPHAGVSPVVAWLPWCRTALVIRDPFGEGSWWYACDGERLAVSSHPSILLGIDWVSHEADRLGVELAGMPGEPAGLSPWRMVRRLPAGQRLVWRSGAPMLEQWWNPVLPKAVPAKPDDDWFRHARQTLERAVARRIPLRGATGAQLSGGLDSSSVSILAARALAPLGRSLHTFSHLPAVSWQPPIAGDESPFVAAMLAAMPNAIPHRCLGIGSPIVRGDGRPLPAHDTEVRNAAVREGLRVVLSGWGGDEGLSFNGDGYLSGELLSLRWGRALGWCSGYGGGTLRGTLGALWWKGFYQPFRWLGPERPHPDRRVRDRWERLKRLDRSARRLAAQAYQTSRRLRCGVGAHENQRRLLTSPHIATRIDSDTEWSIPAGFCFRYPLLDPEVVDVALRAPERLLVLNGRTRTLLREAMRDVLPRLVRERQGKFVTHPRPPEFRTSA